MMRLNRLHDLYLFAGRMGNKDNYVNFEDWRSCLAAHYFSEMGLSITGRVPVGKRYEYLAKYFGISQGAAEALFGSELRVNAGPLVANIIGAMNAQKRIDKAKSLIQKLFTIGARRQLNGSNRWYLRPGPNNRKAFGNNIPIAAAA